MKAEQKLNDAQDSLLNPVSQVYFRAGLLACREYMARFIEAQNEQYAASIRSNWWPSLGDDPGPPRQIEWGELTEGEYGANSFREKPADEVSPSIEALPIALAFLATPIAALDEGEARATNKVTISNWQSIIDVLLKAEAALNAIRDDVFEAGKVTGRSQTLGADALKSLDLMLRDLDARPGGWGRLYDQKTIVVFEDANAAALDADDGETK